MCSLKNANSKEFVRFKQLIFAVNIYTECVLFISIIRHYFLNFLKEKKKLQIIKRRFLLKKNLGCTYQVEILLTSF